MQLDLRLEHWAAVVGIHLHSLRIFLAHTKDVAVRTLITPFVLLACQDFHQSEAICERSRAVKLLLLSVRDPWLIFIEDDACLVVDSLSVLANSCEADLLRWKGLGLVN